MARLALAGYNRAMVLDTSEFGTTRRMLEANPDMHIICPQINATDFDLMLRKRGTGPEWANVRVVQLSMSAALDAHGAELSTEPFIVWRDGTSWWETDHGADRSAKYDFEAGLQVFDESSVSHAVIAFTVSHRGQACNATSTIRDDMDHATNARGLVKTPLLSLSYGNMYFIAVEISRYGAPVPYKMGDLVSVLWPSDTVKKAWKAGGYDGFVDRIMGRFCRVTYMENGVERYDGHSPAELRFSPIAVGDRVGVQWPAVRNGRRSWGAGEHMGIVTRVERGKCYVDYDDETEGFHPVADVRRVGRFN